MEYKSIEENIAYILECMKELHLKPDFYERYKICYKMILEYCEENHLEEFRQADAECLCERSYPVLKKYANNMLHKAAYTLAEYAQRGKFSWKKLDPRCMPVSQNHIEVLNGFEAELLKTLSSGTVRVHLTITRQFLCYLESKGIERISDITTDHVLDFVKQESPNHKASMGKLLNTMKKLVVYLREENIVDVNADRYLNSAPKRRQKVLPCFTDEEIELLFSHIDRSSVQGKRDYAVFLIALRTGLRASDIVKLKLTDVDWNENTINVVQKKTGKALALPLQTDVGNAVADYILNARPRTDNPYIFVRLKRPNLPIPISPNGFNYLLRKYFESAGMIREGWDGKSFHALRRTAGTNMIKTGSPVELVSQVLGHSNINTTKRYIVPDSAKFKSCPNGVAKTFAASF